MLPLYEDLLELENDFAEDFEVEKEPSKTFKIDWENSEVVGYVDGLEAIRQAIYLMLETERFTHAIYSWDYGFEKSKFTGAPNELVAFELEGAIKEALMQDDRIIDVKDFEIKREKDVAAVMFTAVTELGNIESEVNVFV